MNIKDLFVFNKKHTKIYLIIGIFIIILSLLAQKQEFEQQNQTEQNKTNDDNYQLITKDTFNGKWAFNTDKVYLSCIDLGDMKGYKVKIDNKEYSIANVKELPYLPYELWKDVPMENGLCLNGAYSDGKCKEYLDDTIEYANQFCK